jgi:tetratricopeptide (TPR) repeat protein
VYFLKGEEHYADALNNFSAAWQAGALDKRIFYYSGILYEHLSLLDEAERQYRRFLRHEPESREIRLRLARLVFNAGKWEEAIQEYQAWLEEHPEDLTALINCGVAYQEMARKVFSDRKASKQEENAKMSSWVQEGSHYLEKAIQLEPDLPEGVYLSLGRLYYYDGKYEPSAQACEKEVLKNPESSEALKVLVLNYNKLKEDEKELETYLKLSKKFPKDESYKRHIIRLQKRVASSKKL